MCTAISFTNQHRLFGRTLDFERSFGEQVVITPRNKPISFRHLPKICQHFALIGMAAVVENYPLYFDAFNEYGLSAAGLNFPNHACYYDYKDGATNVAPFELILWALCQFQNLSQLRAELKKINLVNTPFSESLPLSPLHWTFADGKDCIVLESREEGLKIYDNPTGVLTNNPPFDIQLYYLNNYINVSANVPVNRFSKKLELNAYSRGMGAIGLPGDLSSSSRFVRAVFAKFSCENVKTQIDDISHLFHILSFVEQPNGCAEVEKGVYELTRYSACFDTDDQIYYYKTYNNHRITGVAMKEGTCDKNELICYTLRQNNDILIENNVNNVEFKS